MKKLFVEKLPLSEASSFICETFTTPHFEVPWHQHIEYELILFTQGYGFSFIGNYVGEFETGDIFFLGSNLPHTFQKRHEDLVTSAIVIQFKDNFWGEQLLRLQESKNIQHLLDTSMQGMKIKGAAKEKLGEMIGKMEKAAGFKRIIRLLDCLDLLSDTKEYNLLSTQAVAYSGAKVKDRLDGVFNYTIEHFKEDIPLTTVAGLAGMSIPAFCSYFRKSTKKTYIEFLNEIRIGFACSLLIESDLNIAQVCYESGFNTLANFNKQFLKIKNLSPLKFRKQFLNAPESGD